MFTNGYVGDGGKQACKEAVVNMPNLALKKVIHPGKKTGKLRQLKTDINKDQTPILDLAKFSKHQVQAEQSSP